MNATALSLTPTTRILAWCLHLLIVGLLALTAVRAVADGRPHAGAVITVTVVCALVYAAGPLLPRIRRSRSAAAWWLVGVGACWLALLALSADGVWVAFPLYFLQLHLLPRRAGLLAVLATAVAAIAAFAAHQGSFSAPMAIGPALGAAVAVAVVWGYQALYRESEERRKLIEELTATRADLAAAQHTAGVLAERERLAREIHDTLAQGLTSIQLLLRAAERALPEAPGNAARHVDQARQAAVDNLAEARRFVAALTPPALEGTTLAGALERLCATTSARHRLTARFRLDGEPVPLPIAHEVALLRIAQSALANTVQHAGAETADVTLCHHRGRVALSVVDDGAGFAPDRLPAPDPESGGFGLAAMRARMHALGGTFTLDSAPGRGTSLTAELPLEPGTESSTDPRTDLRTDSRTEPHTAPRADSEPEADR
ncbi:sensor histidine kinase [Streptomyces sp. LHD-70]|uniref:sensor histidine kinase n=1 Tax=Streptomyces sp. LHD-70 TaxID=3072140 RepID=UPI00281010FA|nr:sensor histidine kinase [Streptomyces sp. LHD-70]MDQ8705507.1 sensor histidine kinase [Streptomyces sp. LHD-70]